MFNQIIACSKQSFSTVAESSGIDRRIIDVFFGHEAETGDYVLSTTRAFRAACKNFSVDPNVVNKFISDLIQKNLAIVIFAWHDDVFMC